MTLTTEELELAFQALVKYDSGQPEVRDLLLAMHLYLCGEHDIA